MNLDRLHELCDWENELSYHDGYVAGYAAANAEMAEAIRFMLGGPTARSWRQAVDQHHWALNARRRRGAADASGPLPGDHLGGPVDFDTGMPLSPDLSDQ
jgi:hypothetical protein